MPLGKHQYNGSQSNYGKPGRLRSKLMTPKERWRADNLLPVVFERVALEAEGAVMYILRKYRKGNKMKFDRLIIRPTKK